MTTMEQGHINSRIDRLPHWGLSRSTLAVFGVCYMLSFYDISIGGITLPTITEKLHLSSSQQALIIMTNLIGYTIGSYTLSIVADRVGRRIALGCCVLVLTFGAALSALSWDAASLGVFRGIVGIGIGAQITLSSTFVGELSPATKRGRYLAISIVCGACGNVVPAVLAIPLLSLDSDAGWRILLALPALIVLILPLFRDRTLPESPRWLAANGNAARADRIVGDMEERVVRRLRQPLPEPAEVPTEEATRSRLGARELIEPKLLRRLLFVIAFWFCWYIVEDGFLSFQTTIIRDLGIHLSDAVVVTAVGFVGGIAGAGLQVVIGDRIERKFLVSIGLVVFTVSFVLLAVAPNSAISAVASFGVNTGTFLTIIPAYTYTAEIFPTRVRASAMGIGDGLGHIAGGVQPYLILPLLATVGASNTLWVLASIALIPLLLILFGKRTTGRSLSEIAQ